MHHSLGVAVAGLTNPTLDNFFFFERNDRNVRQFRTHRDIENFCDRSHPSFFWELVSHSLFNLLESLTKSK